MTKEVADFYDTYSGLQVERGINRRHHRIMNWLRGCGLNSNMRVLEVGCGVGTLTQLLATAIKDGHLLANDISPISIELAKNRLDGMSHVQFICGDIKNLNVQGPFDLIVLPDVLEHIPLEDHGILFRKLAGLLNAEGAIFVHSPSPQYMDWTIQNEPAKLQVIDQPLHLGPLACHLREAGLYIHRLEHYGLWTDGPDAFAMLVRPYRNQLPFNLVPPPVNWHGQLRRRIARLRKRI